MLNAEPLIFTEEAKNWIVTARGLVHITKLSETELRAYHKVHDCPIRWCKSGKPVSVYVNENIGDGSWRICICEDCAKAIGVKENDDLPEASVVERILCESREIGAK